jgi:NAD-dependent DNA ligase
MVECRGGRFRDGVTKATNWLVVGDDAGKKKLADAERLGVKVLTEQQYYDEVDRLTHKKQGYEVGD